MRSVIATCPLCEATCGIVAEVEAERLVAVRGDPDDPFSRGYLCPKGAALPDLQHDPDRLTRPLRRTPDGFVEASWEEAYAAIGAELARLRRTHGKDSVGLYGGNPTVHSHSAILYAPFFVGVLGSRNRYSANSVDILPRLLASYFVYGHQALLPIPDIDRTAYFLILGANPAVSNGSLMTAPDVRRRIAGVRARGGRVVVVDPRRTETAALADEHLAIRPGADALLLLALLHVVLGERPGHAGVGRGCALPVEGLARLRALVGDWPPERVAGATGLAPEQIRRLARDFAAAPSAVAYGRIGTCTQRFGTTTTWLLDCLNIVTGNLDREGGAMIPTPAVDLAGAALRAGQTGAFDRWRSRVRGLPEFAGELPVAALADEIETPGPGQLRALVVHAGNPVLAVPGGARLERALGSLELLVSVDLYVNETSRLAHWILPPTFGLERSHYGLAFGLVSVRDVAKWSPPVLEGAPGQPADWEVILGLTTAILRHEGPVKRLAGAALGVVGRALGPERLLGLALLAGPHRRKARLGRLRRQPHGVDLGALRAGRLRELLGGRAIDLAPPRLVDDLDRLARWLADDDARRQSAGQGASASGELLLIGRRQLRSNNSWMHNVARLTKSQNRCTLLIHPDDARDRGVEDGGQVTLTTRAGQAVVEAELDPGMTRGVVSLPHGWGHGGRRGTRQRVADALPGVSMNDLVPDDEVDAVSGASVLSGIPAKVEAAVPATARA